MEIWTTNACPYCHGFEFSSRPLGVLYCSEASIHQALLIPEWGPTTLFLNGKPLMTEHVELLEQRGVASVKGVYAAGDIARSPHSASWAVADGVTAAIVTHRALVFG